MAAGTTRPNLQTDAARRHSATEKLGHIFTSIYSEIIPIVLNHFSTNAGHCVMGNFMGRSPNACPPCAYKCISTGTQGKRI